MKREAVSLSGRVDSAVPPVQKLRKGKKLRVVVGLSGGVDSAVSAALLQQQGYEVTGVFLECWQAPGCRVDEDRRDAMDVALKLGIPFRVLDFKKEYREKVVEYFYQEYKAGRTPNPDTMCNREIKFGMFYEWALRQAQGKQSRFDYVATGHYARIQGIREVPRNKYQATNKSQSSNNIMTNETAENNVVTPSNSPLVRGRESGGYSLLQGKDKKKDQSYFLYLLRQEQLPHILFPIGGMTKSEVRKKAHELGLDVATKPDSQGICFIGEVSVKQFLQELGMKEKRGKVLLALTSNEKDPIASLQDDMLLEVGEHEGAWFYTVGQRHGFKIQDLRFKNKAEEELFRSQFDTSSMPPLYVLEKDVEQNTLIVGTREQVMKKEFDLGELHWITPSNSPLIRGRESGGVKVRIRHGGQLVRAVVRSQESGVKVRLDEAIFGVAAGQACVFYDDEVCLGGGIIL